MDGIKMTDKGKVFIPWELLDIPMNGRSGDVFTLCPNCSHTRKKNKDKCFGLDVEKGKGKCWHCGAVSVKDSEAGVKRQPKKEYKFVEPMSQNLPKSVSDWFKQERGIHINTLDHFGITYSKDEFMPQAGKKSPCIIFPFHKNGKIVNSKYRDKNKNFKLAKGGELVLFGLDNLKGQKEAIICEGELDAMTIWECGYKNVVSVPNGAGAISKEEQELYKKTGAFDDSKVLNLEYIDNSIDEISHIDKWVIYTDSDIPGLKLKDELIRRFGADNCTFVPKSKYKDANEAYVKAGMEEVQNIISSAKECDIDGLVPYDTREEYIFSLKDKGIEKGAETTLRDFNTHYRPKLGELDIVTGIANHGKSYYILWYCVFTAVELGWKWCLYMPENAPASRIDKTLLEILIGGSFDSDYVSKGKLKVGLEWVKKHFEIIDFEDRSVSMSEVLSTFAQVVKRRGVHGVVVDPLNDLDLSTGGVPIDQYYQKLLSEVRRFKKKHNLKFILSAHPHTGAAREKEEHREQGQRAKVVEISDIVGGNIFHNRTDNGISIYRNTGNESQEIYTQTEIHVQKIKFQDEVGRPTASAFPMIMRFDLISRRYKDAYGRDPLHGVFDKMYEGVSQGVQETFISHNDSIMDFDSEEAPF